MSVGRWLYRLWIIMHLQHAKFVIATNKQKSSEQSSFHFFGSIRSLAESWKLWPSFLHFCKQFKMNGFYKIDPTLGPRTRTIISVCKWISWIMNIIAKKDIYKYANVFQVLWNWVKPVSFLFHFYLIFFLHSIIIIISSIFLETVVCIKYLKQC